MHYMCKDPNNETKGLREFYEKFVCKCECCRGSIMKGDGKYNVSITSSKHRFDMCVCSECYKKTNDKRMIVLSTRELSWAQVELGGSRERFDDLIKDMEENISFWKGVLNSVEGNL